MVRPVDGVSTFGLVSAPMLHSVKAALRERVASEVRCDQQGGRRTADQSVLSHDTAFRDGRRRLIEKRTGLRRLVLDTRFGSAETFPQSHPSRSHAERRDNLGRVPARRPVLALLVSSHPERLAPSRGKGQWSFRDRMDGRSPIQLRSLKTGRSGWCSGQEVLGRSHPKLVCSAPGS